MIAWIMAAVLAVVAIVMVSLYLKAMREVFSLGSMLTMCLLDEGVATTQREGLRTVVDGYDGQDQHALWKRVAIYLGDMTEGVRANTGVFEAVPGMLWRFKTGA